jgi:uroporphyrinogen decarboxylase
MPNEVYEITKNFILECGNCPGGYMLGTACETGPDVRESNLHAVVQACRDFGQYDKNGELIAKGARPR